MRYSMFPCQRLTLAGVRLWTSPAPILAGQAVSGAAQGLLRAAMGASHSPMQKVTMVLPSHSPMRILTMVSVCPAPLTYRQKGYDGVTLCFRASRPSPIGKILTMALVGCCRVPRAGLKYRRQILPFLPTNFSDHGSAREAGAPGPPAAVEV
jgi:hypothetical protein